MYRKDISNDLQQILSQAIDKMKQEMGDSFNLDKINLAELERRTGISRSKLRHYKKDGFIIKPHGNTGKRSECTVLSGFTGVIDELLKKNVTNAVVCYDKIVELGYKGGQTQVRVYIERHQNLIPPKRQIISPQGNRGRRYETAPGESYQMDWGFVNVETNDGNVFKVACFAMICHHCGQRYIEFFPNAKQENLFIGMIHAFYYMGIPENVLTDNMKSVVIRRDSDGNPIWQHDYEAFMKLVGFKTKLCKPRHPFTKGSVERLVRFVKENFIVGRLFSNVTELNIQALRWCNAQNTRYHKAVDCVPDEKHQRCCWQVARILETSHELSFYLCPLRLISFDGFVNYEGRRFGVPYWYQKRTCRIQRKDFEITIYDDDLSKVLTKHDVTWSRKDQFCRDQYAIEQPEEHPSIPVRSRMFELESKTTEPDSGFERFNFGEGLWDE
jgi:transposase